MSQAIHVRRYKLEDYLAMEPEAPVRHEFINGEIFAMTGASLQHNIIVMNLGAIIRPHLRGTPCRVVASDRKVLVAKTDSVYYPDLLVSCGDPGDNIDAYTETAPRLIVEVLSPSTALTDRREKRLAYQQLDSLQDYVLVSQNQIRVEVYHREPEGEWSYREYDTGETLNFPSIDLAIPMMSVYEDVVFDSD